MGLCNIEQLDDGLFLRDNDTDGDKFEYITCSDYPMVQIDVKIETTMHIHYIITYFQIKLDESYCLNQYFNLKCIHFLTDFTVIKFKSTLCRGENQIQ